jgi:hypothetical protein
VGNGALAANTTGEENTANGSSSLSSNTTGYSNTANGYVALVANTTGFQNTAVGDHALYTNTSGGYNIGVGNASLQSNTTGSYNVATGFFALAETSSSQYNTAVGHEAGSLYDNGYNNVFIGANADVNDNDYYDVIAIGQGTTCTAPEQARIGNTFITSIGGQVGWTTFSDGRYKRNIKEDVPGLAFINKLRPITYNLDATSLDNFLHRNQPKERQVTSAARVATDKALKEKEKIKYTGFVAQEVEKSARELGFNFSGVDAPKTANDTYGLRYAEFVVPLVKAVQEQQTIIQNQQQQIDELKKELEGIKAKLK